MKTPVNTKERNMPKCIETPNFFTVADCNVNGNPISLNEWDSMTSEILEKVVGEQSPGGALESANDYVWRFECLDVSLLRCATEDGDEPEGGWDAAYFRHRSNDEDAIRNGSPEYAGRDYWLEHVWGADTRIYPLYIVQEESSFRILDGYHRLAGAFHFGINKIYVLIGVGKSTV